MFFGLGVVLTGLRTGDIVDRKRTSNSYIDGQTVTFGPVRDGDIARTATWFVGIAQDAPLFHHRRETSFNAKSVNQITHSVVAVDEISILSAACGVVAKNINGLHAQRTTNLLRHNRKTQTNQNSNLKVARRHDGIVSVQSRGDCSYPSTRVHTLKTLQALALTLIGSFAMRSSSIA